MNPEQIEMARHALGLPNRFRKSYRNRFVVGPGGPEYALWMDLVRSGHAKCKKGRLPDDDCVFRLTHAGATAALLDGERLDPEDFPAGPTALGSMPTTEETRSAEIRLEENYMACERSLGADRV